MSDCFTCRICGANIERSFVAREMMFGTREEFVYRECTSCGCVQIAEYPQDIGRHYATGYYSFHPGGRRPRAPEAWLRKQRARYALGKRNPVGFALSRFVGSLEGYAWLRTAGMRLDSAILDVGCGNGFLLANLYKDGFRKLEGVDPFAGDEAREQPGFVIRRKLSDVARQPDFALMSHSLEHMPEQERTLTELRSHLGPQSWLCVRIPLANAAWRRYGIDWVQLDPPRHFYLHTRKSFELVAGRAGFRIVRTDFDSDSTQFWGSEQIRRGIPFADPRGHARAIGGTGKIFDDDELAAWEREARELNRLGQGDQATFYLRPN